MVQISKGFKLGVLLSICLGIALILALTGCASASQSSTDNSSTSENSEYKGELSFDNLDPDRTRAAAYAEVSAELANIQDHSKIFMAISGPSISASRILDEMSNLNLAANMWSEVWLPNNANILYYSQDDVDWVDGAACDKAGYCPNDPGSKVSVKIQAEAPYCTGAFSDQSAKKGPFFAQCLGAGSERQKNRQTGPHEYFHWVQFAAIKSNWSSIPNWFIEGSADYFGDVTASWTKDGMADFMDEMQHESGRNWMEQDICPIEKLSTDVISNCFKVAEGNDSNVKSNSRWMMAQLSYYMGSQATEAMVAIKGMPEFKSFLKDLGKMNFDTAFKKHYGLTTEEFYPKVSKYVFDMYVRDK
jgi:hypothetical protein